MQFLLMPCLYHLISCWLALLNFSIVLAFPRLYRETPFCIQDSDLLYLPVFEHFQSFYSELLHSVTPKNQTWKSTASSWTHWQPYTAFNKPLTPNFYFRVFSLLLLMRTESSGWTHSQCFNSNFCCKVILSNCFFNRKSLHHKKRLKYAAAWEIIVTHLMKEVAGLLGNWYFLSFSYTPFSCSEAFTTYSYFCECLNFQQNTLEFCKKHSYR